MHKPFSTPRGKLLAIRQYVKHGMAILPVRPMGKSPLISGGVHSATTDIEEIERYFRDHADANYGIATGMVSNLFVVDVDGKVGRRSLNQLEEDNSALPKTVTVKTPRGSHLYFRANGKPIGNSAGRLGLKVDVRGDGGYVVGPGSINESGDRYHFVDGRALGEISIAKAPKWLLKLVQKVPTEPPSTIYPIPIAKLGRARRYGDAVARSEYEKLRRAQHHHRNDALNRSAFRLGQLIPFGIFDEVEIEQGLARVARSIGLDDAEIVPTIKSGIAAGKSQPRSLPFLIIPTVTTTADDSTEADDTITRQLASFGETDTDNAQRLATRWGHKLIYTRGRGWLSFDGRRWRKDSVPRCIELAKQTARRISDESHILQDTNAKTSRVKFSQSSLSKTSLDRMLELAKGLLEVPDEALDAEPFLLNVLNGTIDLRSGELCEHDPRDYLTKLAPIEADPDAKCPHFKSLLRRVSGGDKEFMRYLRSCVGYTLTGDTREQVFFFCYGKSGNGKSTFVNTIRNLLGDYGSHTPTETLMVKQYDNAISNDQARLDGARMVSAIEANAGRHLDEAKIKAMTGGEKITARFMRKEFFEFTPAFKLWFVANDRPRVRGTDQALWRRIRVLPFNAVISGAEDEIKDFGALLIAEYPGILAWAVRGCLAWQKEGLREPVAVKAAGNAWAQSADHVKRFVDESLIVDGKSIVLASSMFDEYALWCRKNGENALNTRGFKERLTSAHNFEHAQTKRGSEWRGVKIRL